MHYVVICSKSLEMSPDVCSEVLDCSSLDLRALLERDSAQAIHESTAAVADNIINACKLATEKCAHKIMMVNVCLLASTMAVQRNIPLHLRFLEKELCA